MQLPVQTLFGLVIHSFDPVNIRIHCSLDFGKCYLL